MTREQAAAFIIAQAACAMAEVAAMQARNAANPHRPTHPPEDFEAVPDRYGIGHNAVLTFFQVSGV